MSDDATSFVRGICAGAIHDSLLFLFPGSLAFTDESQ